MSAISARLGIVPIVSGGGDTSDVAFGRRLDALRTAAGSLNLDPDAVHLACEIAALDPGLDSDRRFALVLLVLALLAVQQEGSTRLPLRAADGGATLERLLTPLLEDASRAVEAIDAIEELLLSGGGVRVVGAAADSPVPLLHLGDYLYSQRLHLAETRLAADLLALQAHPISRWSPEVIETALSDLDARPAFAREVPVRLTDDQRAALRVAVNGPLTIVTGGPGTGKTTLVLSLLRLFVRLGVSPEAIALAAPTGKAAYRMGEAVASGLSALADPAPADRELSGALPEPRTLHRLLGFSPSMDQFRHHRNNPLEHEIVIVDEGSMIDLALMERLVGAVGRKARLILLGDANQLPSVSAGAVFRDLLPALWFEGGGRASPLPGACARLRESHRVDASDPAGAAILHAANLINLGEAGRLQREAGEVSSIHRRSRKEDLIFEGVELLGDERGMLFAFLERWDAERIAGGDEIAALARRVYKLGRNGLEAGEESRIANLFAHSGRSRVLCLTRVLPRGTERINAWLHRRALARAGYSAEGPPFVAGEPIIMLHNDYDLRLYNGDQGVIVRCASPGESPSLRAIFPRGGGYEAFPLPTLLPHIELCYAMTVHKAQGSEFECVAAILPDRDLPLLTREILYTALTRARRSMVIVGDEQLLSKAIDRPIRRFSGLTERLEEAANTEAAG